MDEKISESATLLSSGATLNADSLVPMTVELPMGGGLKTVRVKFSELITALGYIPLSGTEVGNPVTGAIELQAGAKFKCRNQNDDGWNYMTIDDGGFSVILENTAIGDISLDFAGSGLLSGYIIPFSDENYIQRKYVDNAMIPLDYGDIENVGGAENAQVYTTGTGTGITSVNLSPTIYIGKDVTVSDLGNNASTHNIQIDSGVGNTILYNGVATQVITLTTNGTSVTIRKMTTDKFMVIS